MSATEETNVLPPQVRGDTWEFEVELPEDVSACDFWITLKDDLSKADAEAALQHKTTAPSTSETAEGKYILVVPSDKTGTVTPGKYYADIQRVKAGSPPLVWTFYRSSGKTFEVLPDVTRNTA